MMNITFKHYKSCNTCDCDCDCEETMQVSGDDKFLDERDSCNVDGIVKTTGPCDHPVLVYSCSTNLYGKHLKIVSSECRFLILSDEQERNEVRPILQSLIDRKIFVLEKAERFDWDQVQEGLRQTFYNSDNTQKFKCDLWKGGKNIGAELVNPKRLSAEGFKCFDNLGGYEDYEVTYAECDFCKTNHIYYRRGAWFYNQGQ